MTILFMEKSSLVDRRRMNVKRFIALSLILEIYYYDGSKETLEGEYEVWGAMADNT